jgi:predicted transcriptional regulator
VTRTDEDGKWTLLTAHGRVLVEIARDPDARLRDVATIVGITERSAQAIVADLEAAGYLTRTKVGRRNRYTVNLHHGFRHPAQADQSIGPFLALLATPPTATAPPHNGQPPPAP